jgi:glutamyl/glutaminyl-tRNA synthetase
VVQAAIPFFKQAGFIDDKYLAEHGEYFTHLIDVVRVRVKTLQEVVESAEYFFKPVTSYDPKGEAKHFTAEGAAILKKCIAVIDTLPEFTLASTEEAYNKVAADMGLSFGKVIHPTRLALTGRTVSPGLFDVMILLGKAETLKRLQQAIQYIEEK